MVAQARHFFNLDRAAATGRRLLQPAERRHQPEPVPAPAEQQAPQSPAPPSAPVTPPVSIASFERPPLTYKLELWDALLDWVRQSLQADGCFALDERGFLVAASGEAGAVPPEVYLSAFSGADDTVAPYAGSPGCLLSAVLELEDTRVTLLPVQIADSEVLLGLIAGEAPTRAQQQTIRQTLLDELEHFEATHL